MDSADVLLIGGGKKAVLKPIKTAKKPMIVSKHFNRSAAQWARDVVMKMDDDSARMFVTMVTADAVNEHISANRRVVDRKVAEITGEIAKAAARTRPELMEALSLVSKAMGGDEYDRDSSGRFAVTESRVRTSRGIKAKSKSQERKSGIPSAKGLAVASGTHKQSKPLRGQSRSAYQQQYQQVADALSRQTDLGGGKIQAVLQNKNSGHRRAVDVHGGNFGMGKNMDWWNPGLEDVVAIRQPNTRTGARYDLVSALGANRDTALDVAHGTDTRTASTFADRWNDASRDQRGSSTAQTYRRIGAGAQLLGSVSNSPKAQMAAEFGRFVGEFGPEAEKVIGPTMRRTAYRYRGTEREPDAKLVRNAEMLATKNHTRDYMGMNLPMHEQGRQRVKGASAERKIVDSRTAAIQYFQNRLPDQRLSEVHRKAGRIPPSEGVIIDRNGNIAAQAVGYMEDHYLPFNLKKMSKLNGGTYVRTRSSGGVTSEDIYTGLMSGARQLTVVSNSGIFTIDFADDFRGIRRYSDKAQQMTERYAKTLDAIKNGQIERMPIDPMERAKIAEQVDAEGFTGEERDREISERVRNFKMDPNPSVEEVDKIKRKVAAAVLQDDRIPPGEKARQANRLVQAEVSDMVEQAQQRFYKLDGEGYSIALEAMKEQFPYFVDDIFFINRKNSKDYGQKPTDPNDPSSRNSSQRRLNNASDSGYVKSRYNRPDAVQEGFYDTEITGEGKQRANLTNYQNWQHNPLRGRQGSAEQAAESPAQPKETPRSEGPKKVNYVQQANQQKAAVQRQTEALKPAVASMFGMGENNINVAAGSDANVWGIISEANDDLDAVMSSPTKRRALIDAVNKVNTGAKEIANADPEQAGAVKGIIEATDKAKADLNAAQQLAEAGAKIDRPAYQVGAPKETVEREHNQIRSRLGSVIPSLANPRMGDTQSVRNAKRTVDIFAETAQKEGINSNAAHAAAVDYMRLRRPGLSDASLNEAVSRLVNNPQVMANELSTAKKAQEQLEMMNALYTAYSASQQQPSTQPQLSGQSSSVSASDLLSGLTGRKDPAKVMQDSVGDLTRMYGQQQVSRDDGQKLDNITQRFVDALSGDEYEDEKRSLTRNIRAGQHKVVAEDLRRMARDMTPYGGNQAPEADQRMINFLNHTADIYDRRS